MSSEFIIHRKDLQARERWIKKKDVAPYLHDGRECTVFTFTRQEPTDRMNTRFGGLPYWPRDRSWPVCRKCKRALIFAAQLDFRRTHARSTVPGDVLTFHHCFRCWPWASGDKGGWQLEWHSSMSTDKLINEEGLPKSADDQRFGPFYGVPHNALDYPVPREACGSNIAGESYTYAHFTMQGTKIGGYPPMIQPFDDPTDSNGRAMRFLATIGSIYGFVVDQVDADSTNVNDALLWGDMGCVYLWMTRSKRSAEMTWFIEGY